jgi:hypothetical protein
VSIFAQILRRRLQNVAEYGAAESKWASCQYLHFIQDAACGRREWSPGPSSSILSVIGLAEVDRKRLDFVRWMTYSCWSSMPSDRSRIIFHSEKNLILLCGSSIFQKNWIKN